MPLLLWPRSEASIEQICKLLRRFSNCKSIYFKHIHCISSTSLKLLSRSWSSERSNNVESMYIYHQFSAEYLPLLKLCFPKIKKICINANDKAFNYHSNYRYYITFLIPLIKLYCQSLVELDCNFDTMCDSAIITPQFIHCLQNHMVKLKKLVFGGISMDLTNKNRYTDTEIFVMKQKNDRIFSDRMR